MGLNVFLSYGHDANVALVERIRADLEAAGHSTWIDTARIKFTDDWRHEILAGITAGDCVLAFLSQRSTRDPGVCLDELATAQRDVFVSLTQLSGLSVEAGDCVEAQKLGQAALMQARLLVERFPHLPRHAQDLRYAEALWRRIEAACP